MIYACKNGICQFARVFHVRDLCCAYSFLLHASRAFSYALRKPGVSPAGAGSTTLLPVRHEHMPARLERTRGAAVGGVIPPSSTVHRESAANGAFPVIARALAHAACAHRRAGTVQYLMITVPIDTTLIFKHLQLFYSKMWCQIMLF